MILRTTVPNLTFNRTIIELKLRNRFDGKSAAQAFNRTIIELKLFMYDSFSFNCFLLIGLS